MKINYVNTWGRIAGLALAVGLAAPALPGCGNMGGAAGGGGGGGTEDIAQVPAGAVDPKVERYKVQVGDAAVQGPGTAKVTLIEFSDFQCPFCSRVVPTIEQLQKTYGPDMRFAFKNNPLPFHPNAMPAAKAAVAAGKQGKFYAMYDKLFKNQQTLDAQHYEQWAKELGLDVEKFKKDEAAPETEKAIQADMAEAAKFGARGTPSFFINGRQFSGAQPFDAFKKVFDEEIAAANTAIKAGVKPAQLYAAFTKNGKEGAAAPTPQAPPQDNTVYKAPVGDSPVRGPNDALVTIIQFSDFQCPFCSRVEATMDQVEKDYAGKVRVVWKNNPLPFHDRAMPSAIAAMAAGKQGKFWEMHDTLFKNQQKLDDASLESYAQQAGVDVKKWKASLTDEKIKKAIEADMALAAQLGARGTPSFLINGKSLRGAQPIASFKTAIDAALKDAEALVAKGVKKEDVYAETTKNGKEKADAPAQQPQQQRPADTTVYKAQIGDAPIKGPKDAKVTIVEWSDFQCPFCSRVEPTVDQVMKDFPKDVRVAFKELPLPFHNNAHLAAEAALAAKAQGKFWEMHDTLFKNQQKLARADLEQYAAQIGLDVAKFKADLDSGKWKAKVDAEQAEGNKIGARGTPTFFVNGKSLVGAQPKEAFEAKVKEEIAAADALMAKAHIKADKVYDDLMKDAKEAAAAPPPPTPAGAGDDSKKVYNVSAGNGPGRGGPASAPVQIVMFSDFQCPFCSRVEPTVKQLLDKYGSKVRVTWRNFPLPFHPNAMPAAEAAMAANEQGKFWEMHDKMFANQQALDRATFEKYAQELGLNMDKFKTALDTHAEKAAIDADVQYANGLGTGGMGTPTFFINGRQIAGAQPIDAFSRIVDEELAKKGAK